MSESLEKSLASAFFLVEELRGSLSELGPVESLILVPMIGEAVSIKNRLQSLYDAVAESTPCADTAP